MRSSPSRRAASCSRIVACWNRPCSSLALSTGWLILRRSMPCFKLWSESLVGSFLAVLSLSHLWQQPVKREEAWQLLVGIYAWFTEEFDTKNLQEAKTLLKKLA